MKLFMEKSATSRVMTGVIGLAVAVSLASCSNEAEEAPDIVATPDISQPEQPSQTEYIPASADGPAQNVPEPTLPAIATEETEEGAEAALEFFWQAEEYARMTGFVGPLESISTQECEFCVESIQGWPASYAAGYWNVPAGSLEAEITETQLVMTDGINPTVGHVFFKLHEPATDFYYDSGEYSEESFEAPAVKEWLAVLYYDATSQRWKVDWAGLEENIRWEN